VRRRLNWHIIEPRIDIVRAIRSPRDGNVAATVPAQTGLAVALSPAR